jgi:glycosyltransferase involved in cell wall biosynthesis
MKKVVIFQHRLLHYRTGFFELLRERCKSMGVQLELVHGGATRRELAKKDVGSLEWATRVENHCWEIGDRDIIWQPFPKIARNADLLVVMQESRILSNYPILLKRLFGKRVAYWGHGKNFQSDAPQGLREKWKQIVLGKVDWWFAYTDMTKDILVQSGFPEARVTNLNNAIDTSGFKADLASVDDQKVAEVRASLGVSASDPLALFCGSLYPDKKLELLVEAADYVRSRLPNFSLVVIGDGPSMPFLKDAQKSRPWLHMVGVKKGKEKAAYFRCCDVMLNPGLVGLHIVDAFCAALVMVTTSNARHSPEVAYLKNGINGYSTDDSPEAYGDAVLRLLTDKALLARMKSAAYADSEYYSLENMVENFAKGIAGALQQ